jgi:type IV pilus biogenesis protein CpaD/CtpE
MNVKHLPLCALLCVVTVLLTGCFPQPPVGMPDVSTIGFDGTHAVAPDCNTLAQPSTVIDAGAQRPSMQWGCATYTNLAAQIARPKDLVAPKPMGPANGAVAAAAMQRYEAGQVMKLDEGSTRDSK